MDTSGTGKHRAQRRYKHQTERQVAGKHQVTCLLLVTVTAIDALSPSSLRKYPKALHFFFFEGVDKIGRSYHCVVTIIFHKLFYNFVFY